MLVSGALSDVGMKYRTSASAAVAIQIKLHFSSLYHNLDCQTSENVPKASQQTLSAFAEANAQNSLTRHLCREVVSYE
jgi:hypothetical protein